MSESFRSFPVQPVAFVPEGPRPLMRPMEAPTPFPVGALGPLRDAAEAIAEHTRAPMAICAQAALGAVALVAQAHANVVLPTEAERPLELFLLTIAKSGDRKSAADTLALRPIMEREAELAAAYKMDRQRYEADLVIWDAQRDKLKQELKPKSKEKVIAAEDDLRALEAPEAPLTPILICSEPTIEGYIKLTASGQAAMGLFSAEGGAFIGGFGMSKEHRLKTSATFSTIWDGEPIKRVRAGDGSIALAGRRLTVHLMVQPGVSSGFLDDPLLREQGLLSRILIAAPESTAGTRYFADPSDIARRKLAAYHQRLGAFARLPQPMREGTRNELVPRRLPLGAGARACWIAFHNEVEKQVGADGLLAPIDGLANKAAEHAGRLAGVLALWENHSAQEISEEILRNAIALTRYYLAEALRIRGQAAVDHHLNLAQKVLDWLHKKYDAPALYPAVLYNDCTIREVRKRKTALAVIATLVEHGYLVKLTEPVVIKGSMRKEAWLIVGRTLWD